MYSLRYIYFILIFLVFFISWIADILLLLPHFMTWTIELVLIVLLSYYLLPKIVLIKNLNFQKFDKYIFQLIIFSVLGGLLFVSDLILISYGFRGFFKYILLYFTLINSQLSKSFYKKLFLFWIIMMGIQPLIGIIQFIINDFVAGDKISGSLLSTSNAAVLLTIFILFLIELKPINKIYKPLINIVIILSFLIIPILGESKGFFYLFTLCFFLINAKSIFSMKIQRVIPVISFLLVATLLFNSFYKVNLLDFQDLKNQNYSFSQGGNITSAENFTQQSTIAISISERFLSLVASYNFITESSKNFIFGEGLGSNIFTYKSRKDLNANEIVTLNEEDYLMKYALSRLITNIGFFGLILFALMLIKISIHASRLSKNEPDDFLKSVYKLIPIFSFLYLFSTAYCEPFEDAISFSYWFMISSTIFSKN